jgi:serine/threonine protein kinase
MSAPNDGLHLPPGTRLLNGQYTITAFLGQGGFGITYRVTQHGVPFARAIKECFPAELAERRDGMVVPRTPQMADLLALCLKTFQDEVTHLARLSHPAIVPVMQVFPENGTVYMVLDFVQGPTLEAHVIAQGNHLSTAQIRRLLDPILDALDLLHGEGILHRDIAPDNILLRPDGAPVLIDFGAARQVMLEGSRHVSGLRSVKDCYSPHEFYVRGTKQGPQSDLYGLAATLYRLVAGEPPPSAELRAHALASGEEDPYTPLSGNWPEQDARVLGLIDSALAHRLAARPADVAAWRARLDAGTAHDAPDQNPRIQDGTPPPDTRHSDSKESESSGAGRNWRKPLVATAALLAMMGVSAAFFQTEPVQPMPDPAPAFPLDVAVAPPPAASTEAPVLPQPASPDEQTTLLRPEDSGSPASDPAAPDLTTPANPDDAPQTAEPPPPPPPPDFAGTQSELVQALQSALQMHQCRPGSADGIYGIQSGQATTLFNLVAPASCGRLDVLTAIRDAAPTPDWRASAIGNLQVLQNCQPVPACGTAPGPDFYRDFNKGCWYHATGAHPNEYALWDGQCDPDGFITGNGTLTFVYPREVSDNFLDTKSGVFEKGKFGTGPMTFVRLNGTTERFSNVNGVLDGPYSLRTKGGTREVSGTYRNAQRVGEWTERRSDGYSHRIEYENDKPVRGEIRYAKEGVYEGGLNARMQYSGFGTLSFFQDNGTLSTEVRGGWRQGKQHGRSQFSMFDKNGQRTIAICAEYQNGEQIPGTRVRLEPGQRCF